MHDDSMSLVEHLGELRKRMIWIALVLIVSMFGGFIAAKPVLEVVKHMPPASDVHWNAFAPWDGLRVYIQFSFLIALLVTLPFALYHIWSFVKPGLREVERKAALRYIPFTVVLFLVGVGFAYFIVFPLTLNFVTGLNKSMDLTETYGIAEYFSFMFNILLPLSLLFELPLVILFLTRIGVVSPIRLQKMRRYAYMVFLILATFITPPDIISVLVVTIPIIVLYEISIIFSKAVFSKQQNIYSSG